MPAQKSHTFFSLRLATQRAPWEWKLIGFVWGLLVANGASRAADATQLLPPWVPHWLVVGLWCVLTALLAYAGLIAARIWLPHDSTWRPVLWGVTFLLASQVAVALLWTVLFVPLLNASAKELRVPVTSLLGGRTVPATTSALAQYWLFGTLRIGIIAAAAALAARIRSPRQSAQAA